LHTSHNGITGSGVAHILRITRNGGVGTEVEQGIGSIREVASISGTSVVVIACSII
jgi:hypothetical protein